MLVAQHAGEEVLGLGLVDPTPSRTRKNGEPESPKQTVSSPLRTLWRGTGAAAAVGPTTLGPGAPRRP
jgi:hypothetical protein